MITTNKVVVIVVVIWVTPYKLTSLSIRRALALLYNSLTSLPIRRALALLYNPLTSLSIRGPLGPSFL